VDFAPFLSRTLLGSHGQELLIEGNGAVFLPSPCLLGRKKKFVCFRFPTDPVNLCATQNYFMSLGKK